MAGSSLSIREGTIRLGIVLFAGCLTWNPAGLGAQEPVEVRVLALVDYLAGEDLYLAVGTDHGILPEDTLPAYDGEGPEARRLGLIRIVSATTRRSVANIVGEAFALERGSPVYLGVPVDRLAGDPEIAAARVAPAAGGGVEGSGAQARSASARSPRLDGRVSLDYDAFRTVTRWGEEGSEEHTRTFNTPTFRLQARARNLPGGFNLGTGVRISHRMSSDDLVRPVTSTRIYQLDLEKRFEAVPLEMHLGRFHSPFDEFSGYWDGLLLRVGPRGIGGGVAVGFEPRWSNEGFGDQRPKALGFLDFDARGDRVTYSGAVSFLGIRPRDGLPDRTSVGLSQRLRVGRAWLHQRLEVDQDPSGSEWNLTRLQLDGSLSLAGGLEAFGGWRRWRYLPLWSPGEALGPEEDRAHVGLSLWGRAGGGSVDFSLDRSQDGESGRMVSGSFFLMRLPWPGLGLGASASYWTREDDSSLLLSPEIRASLGSATLRGAYRFYRTVTGFGEIPTHFTDASLTFPLGGGLSVRLQGSTQWGGGLSSNRVFASIWKGF